MTSLENEMPSKKSLHWTADGDLYRIQVREATRYAMFLMDPEGIVVAWNAVVQNLLGYSENEFLGKHASIIFTPPDKAFEVCESELKLAAEKGSSSDIRWHMRKDGTEFFAHGFMMAIRSDAGTLLGFSKILSDETKNKELQDALTESNMALEQFAYIASHDLQEPLRTISLYAEMLARRYKICPEDEAQNFLQMILSGAQRMNALVQDLLLYARVQTEVDRPFSYSLNQDLETALSQLKGLIDETRAIVSHDPLPVVKADQGQMVRLFQNLVGNALKYRKPGVVPTIHISSEQQADRWVIGVIDNGIGFDPKFAKEIFQPFKRLHGQREYPGSGVGLAICRRIVEGHGGEIWAESQPGEGATFHFSLPIDGKARPRHTPSVTTGLQGL
jgi:PAS domain S-box-containing protein